MPARLRISLGDGKCHETRWVNVLGQDDTSGLRNGRFSVLIQNQYFLPLIPSDPEAEGRVSVGKSKHAEAGSLTPVPK